MKRNSDNYLDYIFKIKESLTWSVDDAGRVTVNMENKGITNRLAQLLFKKPKVSQIELQGMGSFIFTKIDGKLSVYEIGKLLHEEYKEDAEPLYERLSVYMKKLEEIGFIERV
jgi:hypothetical protein